MPAIPNAGKARAGQVFTAMTGDRVPMELRGMRAAVLGSTSGIGRAVALALADAGADVIVHGRSSRATAEAVADEIRARGVRSGVLMADLADRDAGDRWSTMRGHSGDGLDAWLHIAGADTLTGAAAAAAVRRQARPPLVGRRRPTIRLCRAVGRRMAAQGSGSIVTMGWDQAETGMEGDSGELFAATKGRDHGVYS